MIAIFMVMMISVVGYLLYHGAGNEILYASAFDDFDLTDFHSVCGQSPLRLETYDGLYAADEAACTLADWYRDPEKTGRASKLKFSNDGDHPIGQYIMRWLDTHLDTLPRPLADRIRSDQLREYSVKITSGDWHYPNHFDASDNYLFILGGRRQGVMNQRRAVDMRVGDVLYLPAGTMHEFKCPASDSLNILFNINFEIQDPVKKEILLTRFNTEYPAQHQRNRSHIDYLL